jgi:hypothetical protein
LQTMRKHSATEDLIEPVIRCWKQKKLQQASPSAQSVANAAASNAAPTSATANAAVGQQVSQNAASSLGSQGDAAGGGDPSAAAAADPTPTDFNNFLFSKWMTLGALTLQER